MKPWQRAWLVFILLIGILHSIRDFEQTVGIKNFLSTIFVKPNGTHEGIWFSANTVLIEGFLLLASLFLLKKNTFGKLGYITICVVIFTVIFWWIYLFLV